MTDAVRLAVPASAEYLRLGRVAASGLASRLGFTYDEIDDLRLALDELCSSLLTMGSGEGEVELVFTVEGSKIIIEGNASYEAVADSPEVNEWSARILDALVDTHKLETVGGKPWFRLEKSRVDQ